ncbi:hypothetical protein ACUM5Y_03890 [Marinomonas dokdonensis]|uniref:hypothetical protein n=1 Tax=Marinomonas dokdonensis TaxID=328224 RepID=UPI0040558CCE
MRNPFSRLVSAYFSPHQILNKGSDEFIREEYIKIIIKQKLRGFIYLGDEKLDENMDLIIRFASMNEGFDEERKS